MNNVYPISALLSRKNSSKTEKNNIKPQVMNITQEKTVKEKKFVGGRYLSALDTIDGLTHLEHRILAKFGSELNFKGDFAEERYIFHDRYASLFKTTRPYICRALKKLTKLGYLTCRKPSKEEWPENHDKAPNFYSYSEKLLNILADFDSHDVPKTYTATYQKRTPRRTKNVHLAPRTKAPRTKAPTMCVEKSEKQEISEQPTHTFLNSSEQEKPPEPKPPKSKEPIKYDALKGILADYLKELTNKDYLHFSITQKVVEQVWKVYPSLTVAQFFDEFEDFKNYRDLHLIFSKNNPTPLSLQNSFIKYLAKKFSPEKSLDLPKPKILEGIASKPVVPFDLDKMFRDLEARDQECKKL